MVSHIVIQAVHNVFFGKAESRYLKSNVFICIEKD